MPISHGDQDSIDTTVLWFQTSIKLDQDLFHKSQIHFKSTTNYVEPILLCNKQKSFAEAIFEKPCPKLGQNHYNSFQCAPKSFFSSKTSMTQFQALIPQRQRTSFLSRRNTIKADGHNIIQRSGSIIVTI